MSITKRLVSALTTCGALALLYLFTVNDGRAEIIPPDRQTAWQGNVGVAGGIPVRTQVCATLSPSGSDASAIQNALNACPENQVVKLNPGVFSAAGTIDWARVKNGVVLRGSGPDKTTISFSSGNMLMRGAVSEAPLSTAVDLSADAVKGQNTLALKSVPSWIKVGHLYILDQLDDPSIVASGGTEGGRSYREIKGNGARGLGQIVRVTAIGSNQVSIETPVMYGFQVGRKAQLAQAAYNPETGSPKRQSGIEDLRLTATYSKKDGHMISMQVCDSCWIKNVKSDNSAGGVHVMVQFSYRSEIRDSHFDDSHVRSAGQAYGVALYHVSSGCLIENNIFERLHAGMMACYGASGNVFGYNYELNGIADSGQVAAISTHGVHAYMNLWEGNYTVNKALGDWTHGSSSHNTVFRNRIVGRQSNATLDQTAVSLEKYNRKWSIVGNILGASGWHDIYSLCPSGVCSQSTCRDTSKAIYKFGYTTNWACNAGSYDSMAVTDAIVHGNYDTVTGQTTWDGGIADRALRSSYYLAGKPSWFGSLAWPPYNPANPTALDPVRIPAGYRYQHKTNPGPGSGVTLDPPKNLRIY